MNLVYETKPQIYTGLEAGASYKMHLVCAGSGRLHTPGRIQNLSVGDIFFTQPAVPSAIQSEEGLRYFYISFLGDRANLFFDRLKLNGEHCHFPDYEALLPQFQRALESNIEVADLYCESLLLQVFADLGGAQFASAEKENKTDPAKLVKKYINDHFSDPGLSLEQIGSALCYNKKYISSVFKARYKVGVSDYLRAIRIQHACTLMEQGFTSVKDISTLCGFADSLYFPRCLRR